MTRADIRGVMVAVECPSCRGDGARFYPETWGGEVVLGGGSHKGSCRRCHGEGVVPKCIPLRDFELMLDLDQEKAESFWESMQKSAEPARNSPSWMKGGINLTERNFTTFRSASSTPASAAPPESVEVPPARGR